ncbi:MAG TPA: heme ABC exporter ATP-binding protein CcmA [Vicinamibacteria bacterium]|nr:heme ABC exporter ATP-binding protein CcmA [Vicinamibacteria bacterium]
MVDSLPPAVETSALGRRFGRRWALAEVTLRVARGVRVMVTGRNGSGKSTLLRVLATALRPDRGSARVGGHDVVSAREAVRRQAALLGHHSGLYEALSAQENLQIAARMLGGDARPAALRERLGEFGLAARADDPVSTFSAGMRKRLSLARTLMQPASVVLLDEPYGELDSDGFALVDRLLVRLRDEGRTVLMSTHLLERGRELCDEAFQLEQGRLVWAGPAADLPQPGAAGVDVRGAA